MLTVVVLLIVNRMWSFHYRSMMKGNFLQTIYYGRFMVLTKSLHHCTIQVYPG